MEDKGHKKLLDDIEELKREAENFKFHDIRNEYNPLPKSYLVRFLRAMVESTKNGDYDNYQQ